MRKIFRRAAARRDLIEHFVHMAQNADEATAERFLASAGGSDIEIRIRPPKRSHSPGRILAAAA